MKIVYRNLTIEDIFSSNNARATVPKKRELLMTRDKNDKYSYIILKHSVKDN